MSSYISARDTKRRNVESLLQKENVVGVGVGRKIVNGRMTDEISIKVYVEKKRVLSRLTENQIIPKEIDDVRTDVVEVGRIRFQGRRDRNRPTRGGDSIGSCHSIAYGYIMAGTLGVALIDKNDGSRVLLSNNHVIANVDTETENRASAGDDIVQPGTLDGGSCTTDVIGSLKRWIPFKLTGDNYVDAAIADLDDEDDAMECEVGCDIGVVNSYRSLDMDDLETQVQKCGRTTGYTTGTVIDVDATVNVGYEVLTSSGVITRTIKFVDQILTTNMSDHGDSGSLLLDMDKKAVGLLFAGSSTISVANRIEVVLDTLDLEFCPGPDIHCRIGGPDRRIEICRLGGPFTEICLPGRPASRIHCIPGRPDQLIFCRPGTPGVGVQCVPGGPDQFAPMCLACGPDSPIGCGAGGPDTIIRDKGCAAGPTMDIHINPGVDPRKLVILDLDKVPRNMRASIEKMLEKMSEER
ncbi:MAG: hypothetical protein ACLFVP_03110 [Candidatus Bathyarchaeia archaeon]